MTGHDDEDLLVRLREIAARVDGPPRHVVETGYTALGTRRIDEQLAELVRDSVAELVRDSLAEPVATARAEDDQVRMLSFAAGPVSVQVDVRGSSLRGLVSGAVDGATAQRPTASAVAPIDAHGWFTFTGLGPGPVRLRFRTPDGVIVQTNWFIL
jgi:hypothetical protein